MEKVEMYLMNHSKLFAEKSAVEVLKDVRREEELQEKIRLYIKVLESLANDTKTPYVRKALDAMKVTRH
jgi:hypothetical protein